MRSVRIFYKKKSLLKFISHLDMTRLMTRLLRKTDIPVWYTEGYNSHLYLTFALPLSLGFESDYEAMDIKLIDDRFTDAMVMAELNRVAVEYLQIIFVGEPIKKVGEIAFAAYKIVFEESNIKPALEAFLSSEQIICQKLNKKKQLTEIDIASKIGEYTVVANGNTELNIILPAGNENLNPTLLVDAFQKEQGREIYCSITRTALLDSAKQLFK